MRRRTLLLGALTVVGCAGLPGAQDPTTGLRDAVDRAAAALASGSDAGGVFDPPARIGETYAGMGGLLPRVTAGDVVVDERGERASTQLSYEWTIRPSQPAWSYTAPLTLLRDPQGEWRAEWTPQVVNLALDEGDSLLLRSLPAQRGEILGANGEHLVYRHAVVRVGIDLANVDRDVALDSAVSLAGELAIDVDRYFARVEAAGPRAFVEAQVLRLEDPVHRSALEAVERIPGVRLINDERMLAVDPTFARPLLGIVGEATAEAIERSGGEVLAGDVVGLSGLQARRDAELRGVPGHVIERRPSGEVLARAEPRRGRPITVSLDIDRQREAEDRVARFGDPCAVVLLRIADGHILAAASGRGGRGFSTATLAQVDVPAPPDEPDLLDDLGWGDPPTTVGTPVFLGQRSGERALVSPLGVALAAVGALTGERVTPVFVVEGTPPARPPLETKGSAITAWLDEIGKSINWWVESDLGMVAVGYVEGGDAATLVSGWLTG